jgi:hypothetical protein
MGAAARTRSPSARHAAAIPTARPGPQRAEAPGGLPHPGQQSKAPAPQCRCDRSPPHGQDCPRADRDRDRPARSARPAVPDTIAEQLAHQQGGVIPARVPGTEHPDCERAGDPRPLRPARPPSRSPGSPAPPSAHPPSPAARPRHITGPAGRVYGNARSTQRHRSSRNRRPARPVRGCPWKADGAHRPSWRPDAVRYTSVDTATQRSTAIQGDT